MIVKSFGCSFVFGTELSDVSTNCNKPSDQAWPALLARNLGCDYHCFAWPGIGNLQILQSLLNNLDDTPALYVVAWSFIDRFDYYDSNESRYPSKWKTIRPAHNNSLSDIYYQSFHSQYQDKLQSLIYIKNAIDCLQQSGQRFIMTYIDDLLFETQWHCDHAVSQLQKYVRPYLQTFEGQTFLQWAKDQDLPVSENMHPLDQAHAAAAQYAENHFLV